MDNVNELFHEVYNANKNLAPYIPQKNPFTATELFAFSKRQHEWLQGKVLQKHQQILIFLVREITEDILARYESVALQNLSIPIYIVTDTYYPHNQVGHLNIVFFFEGFCYDAGFFYLNTNTMPDRLVIAWDRAFFFLSHYKDLYDYAWICEDDVGFTPKSLSDLLEKRKDNSSDFMAARQDVGKDWHLWETLHNCEVVEQRLATFNPLVRASRKFVEVIANVANSHKRLFFLEALFGSVAISSGLRVEFLDELDSDHFHYLPTIDRWDGSERIFHPIKDPIVWWTIWKRNTSG